MDFSTIRKLKHPTIGKFDYLLADLGYNNIQLDQNRGFSYSHPQPLDMRYSPTSKTPASHLLSTSTLYSLTQLLHEYGQVSQPDKVASWILQFHQKQAITTTDQLVESLKEGSGRIPYKLVSKVFQAIRMAVNGEARKIEQLVESSV